MRVGDQGGDTRAEMHMVIFFQGGQPEGDLAQEAVLDVDKLPQSWWASGRLINLRGYKLVNLDGAYATSAMSDALDAVNGTVVGKEARLGRLYIFGSSAGGRMALRLAQTLTAKGPRIRYLGITDAAFFPNEAESQPKSLFETSAPTFRIGAPVSAEIMRNYYHTMGNHVRPRLRLGREFIWFSLMPNSEIHGKIPGFTNPDADLTSRIRRAGPDPLLEDFRNHELCNDLALRIIRDDIIADLMTA